MDQINHRIGVTPPIIENILVHLPMKDLNRCAMVCKLWNQTVQIIKRKRHQISWMFWLSHSFGKSKKGPVGEIDSHISEILKNISSQPKLAILFASHAFFDDQAMFMKSTNDSETPMIDHLMAQLPVDCLLLGTSCDGIVGTTVKCDHCSEIENKPGFTCLLLPDVPGVEVYTFMIKDLEDIRNPKTRPMLSDDELTKLTKIPTDKEVKSLIFFCSEVQQGGEAARLVAKSLLHKQNHKLSVGGGFVDTLVAPKSMLSEHIYLPHTLGIAFCGDKVHSASVMMKGSVRRKETVQKILMQLKNCNLPEEKSLAFMFACVGRGEGHYGEPNVEAEMFHKIFPKTPLFGFFGNGEIGLNCLLSSKVLPEEDYSKIKIDSLFNSYTTVFVLISFPAN